MNLVIPLRNNGDFNQLRFALRSITAHHNITNCIIIGGKPTWYTGKHINHNEYTPDFKEANIRDKVLAAASIFTGEFLFANDDHILLSPIDRIWNKGLLSECLNKRIGNGSYTRCLRNTFEHYGDVFNVDTHCPMMMNTDEVKRTNFEWPRFGIGFKTCYVQENKLQSEYMEDCKTSIIPTGRQWFSLTDNFPIKQLVELFPEKSIFEL
jgi:hypothetical protein